MPGPAAGLIAAALAAADAWTWPGVSGTAGRPRVVAIGWATVELDRATAELGLDLGLAPDMFIPADPSVALGAECRLASGVLADGRSLAVLEPATEGPLAAALARWGEGPRVVWLEPRPVPKVPEDPDDEVVDPVGAARAPGSAGSARSAGSATDEPFPPGPARPGPFGPERRLPGGWLDDPVRLLLIRLPGTIRP